jgi:subtilisin family serine protease
VAVVDSGVDGTHPDLAPNMWTNPNETPGNGQDDDGNGLIDDTRGWDWVGKDNDPNDENGHGTHVAGIVGARGNNAAGVTGVNWEVRLMPLRVLDAAGSGWTSDVAEAFAYAGEMGVDVVNASLAGNAFSEVLLDSIAASPGTLFVVAAGNESRDVGLTPSYPCSYPLPNIICVAATGQSNQLSSYSNFGSASVDLAAPGDAILSTWPGGTYNEGWGTSSATPHVAGVAALLGAQHPEASADRIRTAILAGAEPLGALAGRTVTGGRLNAAGAFQQMGDMVPEEQPTDTLSENRDPDKKKKRCTSKRRGRKGKRARKACRARNSR